MKSAKMLTILALGLMAWMAGFTEAAKMGTAWTYQGRLIDANYPADGLYDFQFRLFDAYVAGTQQSSTVTVNEADVIDGYFTVELDFGSDVFDGSERWLQIEVRAGKLEDPALYTPLNPRRKITPAPYALQTRGIFVDNGGNVGIGNTSPTSPLHVTGQIKANSLKGSPHLYVHSDGDIEFKINSQDNPAQFSFFELFNGKSEMLWYVSEAAEMGVKGNTYLEGNVGIGTTSPSSRLHIEDNTTGDVRMMIHNLDNTGTERLYFGSNTSDAGMIVWGSNNASYPGKWRFFNNKTSAHYDWIAGSSVKMTLDNDGKLGIGNDSPEGMLDVRSSSELVAAEIRNSRSSEIAYGVNVVANGTGGTKHYAGRFNASGATENFSIYADGVDSKSYFGGNVGIETKTPSYPLHVVGDAAKTTGIYWTNISDRNLKRDIKPLEGALDRLTRLKGRTFKWKDPAELNAAEGTHIGLVAQEVEEVFPKWVSEDNQGRKQVTLEGLEAVTIEAIKELKLENELLRKRLEILEQKLNLRQSAANKDLQE